MVRNRFQLQMLLGILFCASVASAAGPPPGAAPHAMNFSGYLTSTNGSQENGTYDMRFILFVNKPIANTPIWAGEYTSVTVTNGQFSVALGTPTQGGEGIVPATWNNPLPTYSAPDLPIASALLSGIDSTYSVTLELEVLDGSTWDVMSPQFPISSALFALQAEVAQTALSADALQSVAVNPTAPTLNQVLQYDGTQWTATTITSSIAAAGLNGQLQFNSSGSLGASSNLFWDQVNSRLGIDANPPSSQLDISGTNANGTLRVYDQTAVTGNTREIIRAGAGQTSNLTEWQNSAGTTVEASMNAAGQLAASSVKFPSGTGSITLQGISTGTVPITLNLPDSIGGSGNILTSDGTGNLVWASSAASGGISSIDTSGATVTNIGNGTNTGAVNIGNPTGGIALGGSVTLSPFSGDQGSVLFLGAGGAISQDNSQFYWDDTNHRLGIGVASPSYPLQINSTNTLTSGAGFGINEGLSVNPGAASTAGIAAADFAASYDSTQDNSGGTVYGVEGYANNNSTATVGLAMGGYGNAQNLSTGTITTATGEMGVATNSSTGTITTAQGLRGVINNTNAGGTITTSYEAYLNTNNSGTITNQYGLYQNDAASKNYFAGKVGIGVGPSHALQISDLPADPGGAGNTVTSMLLNQNIAPAGGGASTTFHGAYLGTTLTGTGGDSENFWGAIGSITTGTSNSNTNFQVGTGGQSWNSGTGTTTSSYGAYDYSQNSSSGNMTSAYGVWAASINSGTGTITSAYGAAGQVENESTGTITNATGLVAPAPINSGGGTITNYYGLYLGNPTTVPGVTNSWSIYSAGGNNYFAGNVGIGTTSPQSALNVTRVPAGSSTGSASIGEGGWTGGGAPNFSGSANGTELAVNSAAAFTGNLIDLQQGGVSRFSVSASGAITTASGETANGTVDLNTAAVGSGATYIGTGASATGVSIGTSGAPVAGVVDINSTGGTTNIGGGTGTVNIAASTGAATNVNIGTGTSSGAVSIGNSTGGVQLSPDVGIGAAPVSGTVLNIASVAQSGVNTYGLAVNSPTGGTNNYAAAFMGGNVGIGTTAPGFPLEVEGADPTNSSTGQLGIQGTATTGAAGTGSGILFLGNDGVSLGRTWGAIQALKENSTAGDVASYMSFSTRTSGQGDAEKMRITSTGNVGIGTTSPASELNVVAPAGSGATVQAQSAGAGSGVTPLYILSRAENTMASPSADLSGDYLGALDFGGYDGTVWTQGWNGGAEIDSLAAENWNATSHGTSLEFRTTNPGTTNATVKMSITASGELEAQSGIGTTGGLTGAAASGIIMDQLNANTSRVSLWGPNTTTLGQFEFYQASSDNSLNSVPFFINSSGAVGIGIGASTPEGALQVGTGPSWSSFNMGASLVISGTRNNGIGFLDSGGNNPYAIGSFATGFGIWSMPVLGNTTTAPTPQLVISNTGNGIGLGTDLPAAGNMLTVNGSMVSYGNIVASGCVSYNGGTSGTCASDRRLKKDISPFTLGLDQLIGMQPVHYRYNGLGGYAESKDLKIGVIAQELEKVAPSLVETRMVKLHPDDKEETQIKVVNYNAFTYMLINSVKSLYAKFMKLEEHLTRHDSEIAQLKAENAELKALLQSRAPASVAPAKTDETRLKKLESENAAIKAWACSQTPRPAFCDQ